MPVRKEYTAEFEEQAGRLVFEEIAVDEPRSAACERLGPKLNAKPATLRTSPPATAARRQRSG